MSDDRFRGAARAYFIYGLIYWIGGVYLVWQGVGVSGGRMTGGLRWVLIGAVLVVLIPYLLRRPRAWFERWILFRRDFARIVSALMAYRAFEVARIALRSDGGSVEGPWGGVVTFQAGAVVFFVVTVVALLFVARAAWHREAA